MGGYTMGQAERLLNLPASTLRFWEKEVPFLAPRKDVFGRRVYSSSDLCVLARLRHLAFARGMGLAAASRALEDEMMKGDPSLKAALAEMRSGLLALHAAADDLSRRMEGSST